MTGRDERDNRKAKAAAMRAQAARAEARRRQLVAGVVVLIVLVLTVGTFVLVQNSRRDSTTAAATGSTPANLGPKNSIVVGQADAPVTVVAYEDFMCPFCNQFEQANSAQLDAWVKAGTVRIDYRPVSILDGASDDEYSTRALNAVGALVNSAPDAYPAYHKALFAQQPEENGPGLTNQQLIDLAVAAGAPKAAMTTAVNGLTYKAWTKQATEQASQDGLNGTPYVLVNGKALKGIDAATMKTAVDAATAAAR